MFIETKIADMEKVFLVRSKPVCQGDSDNYAKIVSLIGPVCRSEKPQKTKDSLIAFLK